MSGGEEDATLTLTAFGQGNFGCVLTAEGSDTVIKVEQKEDNGWGYPEENIMEELRRTGSRHIVLTSTVEGRMNNVRGNRFAFAVTSDTSETLRFLVPENLRNPKLGCGKLLANLDQGLRPTVFISSMAKYNGDLRRPPPDDFDLRDVATQIKEALEKLKTAGVVHRDLKPDNIFWRRGGDESYEYALGDFGLATWTNAVKPGYTEDKVIAGTEKFGNVEMLRTWKQLYDPSKPDEMEPASSFTSDRFALGATLLDVWAASKMPNKPEGPPLPERLGNENKFDWYERAIGLWSAFLKSADTKVPAILMPSEPQMEKAVKYLIGSFYVGKYEMLKATYARYTEFVTMYTAAAEDGEAPQREVAESLETKAADTLFELAQQMLAQIGDLGDDDRRELTEFVTRYTAAAEDGEAPREVAESLDIGMVEGILSIETSFVDEEEENDAKKEAAYIAAKANLDAFYQARVELAGEGAFYRLNLNASNEWRISEMQLNFGPPNVPPRTNAQLRAALINQGQKTSGNGEELRERLLKPYITDLYVNKSNPAADVKDAAEQHATWRYHERLLADEDKKEERLATIDADMETETNPRKIKNLEKRRETTENTTTLQVPLPAANGDNVYIPVMVDISSRLSEDDKRTLKILTKDLNKASKAWVGELAKEQKEFREEAVATKKEAKNWRLADENLAAKLDKLGRDPAVEYDSQIRRKEKRWKAANGDEKRQLEDELEQLYADHLFKHTDVFQYLGWEELREYLLAPGNDTTLLRPGDQMHALLCSSGDDPEEVCTATLRQLVQVMLSLYASEADHLNLLPRKYNRLGLADVRMLDKLYSKIEWETSIADVDVYRRMARSLRPELNLTIATELRAQIKGLKNSEDGYELITIWEDEPSALRPPPDVFYDWVRRWAREDDNETLRQIQAEMDATLRGLTEIRPDLNAMRELWSRTELERLGINVKTPDPAKLRLAFANKYTEVENKTVLAFLEADRAFRNKYCVDDGCTDPSELPRTLTAADVAARQPSINNGLEELIRFYYKKLTGRRLPPATHTEAAIGEIDADAFTLGQLPNYADTLPYLTESHFDARGSNAELFDLQNLVDNVETADDVFDLLARWETLPRELQPDENLYERWREAAWDDDEDGNEDEVLDEDVLTTLIDEMQQALFQKSSEYVNSVKDTAKEILGKALDKYLARLDIAGQGRVVTVQGVRGYDVIVDVPPDQVHPGVDARIERNNRTLAKVYVHAVAPGETRDTSLITFSRTRRGFGYLAKVQREDTVVFSGVKKGEEALVVYPLGEIAREFGLELVHPRQEEEDKRDDEDYAYDSADEVAALDPSVLARLQQLGRQEGVSYSDKTIKLENALDKTMKEIKTSSRNLLRSNYAPTGAVYGPSAIRVAAAHNTLLESKRNLEWDLTMKYKEEMEGVSGKFLLPTYQEADEPIRQLMRRVTPSSAEAEVEEPWQDSDDLLARFGRRTDIEYVDNVVALEEAWKENGRSVDGDMVGQLRAAYAEENEESWQDSDKLLERFGRKSDVDYDDDVVELEEAWKEHGRIVNSDEATALRAAYAEQEEELWQVDDVLLDRFGRKDYINYSEAVLNLEQSWKANGRKADGEEARALRAAYDTAVAEYESKQLNSGPPVEAQIDEISDFLQEQLPTPLAPPYRKYLNQVQNYDPEYTTMLDTSLTSEGTKPGWRCLDVPGVAGYYRWVGAVDKSPMSNAWWVKGEAIGTSLNCKENRSATDLTPDEFIAAVTHLLGVESPSAKDVSDMGTVVAFVNTLGLFECALLSRRMWLMTDKFEQLSWTETRLKFIEQFFTRLVAAFEAGGLQRWRPYHRALGYFGVPVVDSYVDTIRTVLFVQSFAAGGYQDLYTLRYIFEVVPYRELQANINLRLNEFLDAPQLYRDGTAI